MKNITLAELEVWKSKEISFELIDVREEEEHEYFNIGGQLIPLSDILKEADVISKNKPVIVYCKRGIRSQIAIQKLEQKYRFDNLYNLQGGILKMIK